MVSIIYGDVEFFWENIYNGNVGLILSISRKERNSFYWFAESWLTS